MAKPNTSVCMKSTQELSPREKSLFDLIPAKPKTVTSKELVDLYYGPNPPFNALKIIVGRVNGIAAKLAYSGAKFRIGKARPDGQRSMAYCREKA